MAIKNRKKISLLSIGFAAVLILSAVFLWHGQKNSVQSSPPMIVDVSFQGEYKIGDGPWLPIVEGEHIPSTKGDVTLRGLFQMFSPEDGAFLGYVPVGQTVSLYFNHIGGYTLTSQGERIPFDSENPAFGEDSCVICWGFLTIAEEGPVTIVLSNPHSYGNENAVDDFLERLFYSPADFRDQYALQEGAVSRNLGLLILLSSLIVLGISFFSTIIHIPGSRNMWLIGLMSLFAGMYFMFDAFGVSVWNDSYVTNTRVLGLSMMFYTLFLSALICSFLRGTKKKIALTATALSYLTVLCCICVSMFTRIHFFDTWGPWALVESAVAITLILCQLFSLKKDEPFERLLHSIAMLTLGVFLIDVLATKVGWWEGGLLSKQFFIAVFVISLVLVLRVISSHINAAIKAKQLEAEQQALKLELQESRISIMLSQMQPHFIFNTLNTIYHLCEINPDQARSTISSFSEYLRNNIDNLGQSDLIPFEKELSFVKTYLDIEKVRFDDELEINLNIEATNFKLPVLTIQPIVENAVKHGTSKKEGVARLFLSTRETPDQYVITISDTGVGFDPDGYQMDGHKHVGISSVRQRLENLCNGSLTIESAVGIGTRATIRIPKKEELTP